MVLFRDEESMPDVFFPGCSTSPFCLLQPCEEDAEFSFSSHRGPSCVLGANDRRVAVM